MHRSEKVEDIYKEKEIILWVCLCEGVYLGGGSEN